VHLHRERVGRSHASLKKIVVEKNERFCGPLGQADRHHQPGGVNVGGACGLPKPATEHHRHFLHVGEPTPLDAVQVLVEVLAQFRADAHRRLELFDELLIQETDATLTLQQPPPAVLGIGGQRRT
jgi:hypothetical protein